MRATFANIIVLSVSIMACGRLPFYKKSSEDAPAAPISTPTTYPAPENPPTTNPDPKNPSPATTGGGEGGTTLTFASINPILKKHCAPCHTSTSNLPLIGNETLVRNKGADIVRRIYSADPQIMMPRIPKSKTLTAAQKHKVLAYFGREPLNPGEATVTYAGGVFPILAMACVPCHAKRPTDDPAHPTSPLHFVGDQAWVDQHGQEISDRITTTDTTKLMPPEAPAITPMNDDEKNQIAAFLKN